MKVYLCASLHSSSQFLLSKWEICKKHSAVERVVAVACSEKRGTDLWSSEEWISSFLSLSKSGVSFPNYKTKALWRRKWCWRTRRISISSQIRPKSIKVRDTGLLFAELFYFSPSYLQRHGWPCHQRAAEGQEGQVWRHAKPKLRLTVSKLNYLWLNWRGASGQSSDLSLARSTLPVSSEHLQSSHLGEKKILWEFWCFTRPPVSSRAH